MRCQLYQLDRRHSRHGGQICWQGGALRQPGTPASAWHRSQRPFWLGWRLPPQPRAAIHPKRRQEWLSDLRATRRAGVACLEPAIQTPRVIGMPACQRHHSRPRRAHERGCDRAIAAAPHGTDGSGRRRRQPPQRVAKRGLLVAQTGARRATRRVGARAVARAVTGQLVKACDAYRADIGALFLRRAQPLRRLDARLGGDVEGEHRVLALNAGWQHRHAIYRCVGRVSCACRRAASRPVARAEKAPGTDKHRRAADGDEQHVPEVAPAAAVVKSGQRRRRRHLSRVAAGRRGQQLNGRRRQDGAIVARPAGARARAQDEPPRREEERPERKVQAHQPPPWSVYKYICAASGQVQRKKPGRQRDGDAPKSALTGRARK